MSHQQGELPSVIPEQRIRTITYDMGNGRRPPMQDDFIVTVGKKGAGSVYLVASCRPTVSKSPRPFIRYSIGVISCPELLPLVTLDLPHVFVDGKDAFPLYWYSRNKKKKR